MLTIFATGLMVWVRIWPTLTSVLTLAKGFFQYVTVW